MACRSGQIAQGRIKGDPNSRKLKMDVTLNEGENVLRVLAAHEKATSKPAIRTIIYEPKVVPTS